LIFKQKLPNNRKIQTTFQVVFCLGIVQTGWYQGWCLWDPSGMGTDSNQGTDLGDGIGTWD